MEDVWDLDLMAEEQTLIASGWRFVGIPKFLLRFATGLEAVARVRGHSTEVETETIIGEIFRE